MANKGNTTVDLTGRRRGWRTVIAEITRDTQCLPRLVELARERRWQLISLAKFYGNLPANISPHGAIVDALPSHPVVRSLVDRGVPTVRIGWWPHPDDAIVPAVMTDRPAAGRMAAEHFAERDFKHVAFVGRDPWGDNEPIYDALAARAADLNCACHLLRLKASSGIEIKPGEPPTVARLRAHQHDFTRWLNRLPRPVGLLAFGDRHADRYNLWASEAGLRVPEDVAVMGLCNEKFVCESAIPPLTSVAFDDDRIAETAAQMLGNLMDGQTLDQTTVMVPPLGIVVRQSTDVLAASDPLVVAALRYMWDHVDEDLGVEQIAKHVGVNRRTLEKAFRQELGRGINAEFQRRRLERVRELLVQSDLTVGQIASALSFNSQTHLGRVFKAEFGSSPGQYRRDHQASV